MCDFAWISRGRFCLRTLRTRSFLAVNLTHYENFGMFGVLEHSSLCHRFIPSSKSFSTVELVWSGAVFYLFVVHGHLTRTHTSPHKYTIYRAIYHKSCMTSECSNVSHTLTHWELSNDIRFQIWSQDAKLTPAHSRALSIYVCLFCISFVNLVKSVLVYVKRSCSTVACTFLDAKELVMTKIFATLESFSDDKHITKISEAPASKLN